jgi:uroporphyrinogen decarboxylase
MFPVKTLEKTDRFIVQTTPQGGVSRNFWDYSTTPEVVERPIKEKRDWEKIKERLKPDYTRVDWVTTFHRYETARSEGKFITLDSCYGYDGLQNYVRSEDLLVMMVAEPDWVKEMIDTLADLTIEMAKIMMDKGLKPDGFWSYNDMGYRNGLLFSPQAYRATHKEADKKVYGFFRDMGMPVILHSCGNVEELIPDLIEVGLSCLQPLEVKAGMDLIKLKREFGDRLAFMGGIDVRAMFDPDPRVIEEETKTKFEVAKTGGGYIYHSDHSVPNTVSLDQYKRVMELVERYGKY